MKKTISYSLFGFNNQNANSFDFKTYLRYLGLNIRMKQLIYPDWDINLITDIETYTSVYQGFFDFHTHSAGGSFKISFAEKEALCKMMIKRLMPLFFTENYDYVICRDIDSLVSYREAQAVQLWILSGLPAHAITDSVSHTVPLMGGMIGFKPNDFKRVINVNTFQQLIDSDCRVRDWSVKGTDQDFLGEIVYPKFHNKIIQHYVLGMPSTGSEWCFNSINNINLEINSELRESNLLINHIGQSGAIIEPVLKFLEKFESVEDRAMFQSIEKSYTDVFYWHK